ncbi:hypothetical protein TrVE_jg8582 [Triparma verrucosa]|uniref:Non-canonical E2 ubiquitin-conjugating enzyme C-terminal domain-containing protein n=1 Tax=Triparma verrucosa TaxID=1606542 RepID=A0A9W7FGK7_9STRA|nr:hypothetical protein TrVE_jg8582 [Triparma verrucosa]
MKASKEGVSSKSIKDFCSTVPVRLSDRERILLNVLHNALEVSEYTDNVDIVSRRNKANRILQGILEVCAITLGLGLCGTGDSNRVGLNVEMNKAAKEEPSDNEALLQEIFEVGRRNKILNPSKMRSTYGKLMYLMQDAQASSVARGLGFSLYKDLVMVQPYLQDHGAGELLDDGLLPLAVCPVTTVDEKTGEKLSREEINTAVQQKRDAIDELVDKYASTTELSEENARRVIDSIADAYTVVASNVRPVVRMLELLEDNFVPNENEEKFSLQLSGKSRGGGGYGYGMGRFGFGGGGGGGSSSGATLTHDHTTQYWFVWQTLKLWEHIQKNMHSLWVAADDDLLSTSCSYSLWNTGQGLNRVQNCPKVARMMHNYLSYVQSAAGRPWVGLSVVHLGDRDVPNALVFIDKYTQVPRILQPIVDFIDGMQEFCSNPKIQVYVADNFTSQEKLRKKVLADYFKHGFDGSGDDGGSCIDGRLTSSWNWTSRIAKKSYHHAFLMSGFQGFDGDDWKE